MARKMDKTTAEIRDMSSRLRIVVTIALFLLPLLWLGDILQARAVGYVDYGAPDRRLALDSMPASLMAAAALLRALELLPVAGALWTLRALLDEWRSGAIFTLSTISHFRRIGVWLVLLAVIELATSAAMGPLAWWAGYAGFSVHMKLNVSALLIGVLVMLLARIMRVGVLLQNQADLTI
jgi:hypothetical protein